MKPQHILAAILIAMQYQAQAYWADSLKCLPPHGLADIQADLEVPGISDSNENLVEEIVAATEGQDLLSRNKDVSLDEENTENFSAFIPEDRKEIELKIKALYVVIQEQLRLYGQMLSHKDRDSFMAWQAYYRGITDKLDHIKSMNSVSDKQLLDIEMYLRETLTAMDKFFGRVFFGESTQARKDEKIISEE